MQGEKFDEFKVLYEWLTTEAGAIKIPDWA